MSVWGPPAKVKMASLTNETAVWRASRYDTEIANLRFWLVEHNFTYTEDVPGPFDGSGHLYNTFTAFVDNNEQYMLCKLRWSK